MILMSPHKSFDRALSRQMVEDAKALMSRHESLKDSFQLLRYESLCKPRRQVDHRMATALALASAAMTHCYGLEPYPTQLLAAQAMASGQVVDLATGEGKSIAVLLAAIAMTAQGYGVHIATANDYLAQRDCEFAQRVLRHLGLRCDRVPSTGCETMNRLPYQADLTFSTLSGFAFDHLRDELVIAGRRSRSSGCANPKVGTPVRRHRLIIDEIDHCLLDEAGTPFVIADAEADMSGVGSNEDLPYQVASELARKMRAGIDFQQASAMDVRLTQRGEQWAQTTMPRHGLRRPWTDYLLNALRAAYGLKEDVDYTVDQSQLRLIDKATGRFADGRQWQAGLHQAVQSYLNLPVDREYQAVAQITARQFISQYHQVSGCSGTARAGRQELSKVYGLDVKPIPERVPSQRLVLQPKFFANQATKLRAIVDEVVAVHQQQRPVLIGTRSIAQSHEFAAPLRSLGLKIQLLNGIQDRGEAEVIAHAGQRSAITVATDMAGRGTDIPIDDSIASIGGLHVIVSELSSSPRIDQQLMGRAARQGQPGSSRVFVAADDQLIREHAPALERFLMHRLASDTDHRWLWKEVVRASNRSERSQSLRREAAAFAIDRHSPHSL